MKSIDDVCLIGRKIILDQKSEFMLIESTLLEDPLFMTLNQKQALCFQNRVYFS